VHAQAVAVRVRKRVNERAEERSPRRYQFRVFAAARVDGEWLATGHRRHLVRVQAGGVDHLTSQDRFTFRAQQDEVSITRKRDGMSTESRAVRDARVLPGDVVYVFERHL